MTDETQISADPDVPLIRVVREFAATPAQVFRAHTDPELVIRWLGPRDLLMTIDTWDCRSGGSYRYTHTRAGEHFHFFGSFHEVRPDEAIVQTFTFAGFPDAVALERLALTDLGGGRTRLVATSLTDSFEGRDAMLASGMQHGIREGYERLDEIFTAAT